MKNKKGFHFDFSTINHYCQDLFTKKETPSSFQILKKVTAFYNITPEAITSSSRAKKFSLDRHLVAYICIKNLKLTLKETAKIIGRKDHVSVIHACKKIEKLMKEDLFFRQQVLEMFLLFEK